MLYVVAVSKGRRRCLLTTDDPEEAEETLEFWRAKLPKSSDLFICEEPDEDTQ